MIVSTAGTLDKKYTNIPRCKSTITGEFEYHYLKPMTLSPTTFSDPS